jgi:hypothetical protein
MIIPFGPWAPAQASHAPNFCSVAEGVFPLGARDWRPFPQFNHYAEALSSAPLGGFQCTCDGGLIHTFCATADGVFRLNTGVEPYEWDDITGTLDFTSVTDETFVSFRRFGTKLLIAASGLGGIGQANIGSGSFALIANSPQAVSLEVFGDRVWALGKDDAPREVEWSGLNDQTVWGDYAQGADSQPLERGGPVTCGGVAGGTLFVFQEDGVQAFNRNTSPVLFDRTELRQNFGAPSGQALAMLPTGLAFMSEDGFYLAQDGGNITNIGGEFVDEWFFTRAVDLGRLWSVQAAHDPVNKFAIWRYPSSGWSETGTTDRVIGYSYALNRWFGFELESSWVFRASSPGVSLDSITTPLDDLTISLDSRTWVGGRPQLGGFDSSYRYGFYDGIPMAAQIETNRQQFASNKFTYFDGFRPVIQGTATYTGQIGVQNSPEDETTWKLEASANRTGKITQRANGLYLQFRLKIAAGESWQALTGIEVTGGRPGDEE